MGAKVSKTMTLLRKLQHILLTQALLTIYKALISPYLDYGDILYDKSFNASFHQKIEPIQYNACVLIKSWVWNNPNIDIAEKLPEYLFQLITSKKSSYTTRNAGNILFFKFYHSFFKICFFVHCY